METSEQHFPLDEIPYHVVVLFWYDSKALGAKIMVLKVSLNSL